MTLTRPSTVWTIFAICCTVLLLAMGLVSTHTLQLEESRRQAEIDRDLEERMRLALWRMDSAAGAMVFSESARPPEQFKAFHAAEQVYTDTFQIIQKGRVILPSPLLNAIPKHSKLYCQTGPDGTLTSPQIPVGNNRDLAEQNYLTNDDINSAAALLENVRRLLPAVSPPQTEPLPAPVSAQVDQGEYNSRSKAASKGNALANSQNAKLQTQSDAALQQVTSAGANVTIPNSAEPFKGLWLKGELFLSRKATLNGLTFLQYVWLDSASVMEMLLEDVRDILPAATLSPFEKNSGEVSVASMAARSTSLVALPFQLEPGEVPLATIPSWSPTRRSLAIAWTSVLIAAAAAVALVFGIVGLSERRAAFVSAVTHEMRTPLTTFRLYSEMLSSGMVKDPEKQKDYLFTLTSEADRLSHLVENVLTYARLERGSARAQVEETTLSAIIDRVKPRLDQRAAQDNCVIQVDADNAAADTRVKVDLTAVEQILFNLVDNACKYGRHPEGENIIHLEAENSGHLALLRIRDHGRGISPTEERRLFRPFEKSADEAAHTANGVGLGLALCRKLSRALGGNLSLNRQSKGACFVLELPALRME